MAAPPPTTDSLRPWQFFTLGALVCATAAVFIIRGTSAENLIFVCLGIFAAALVGLAALRTFLPLATGETREPEMVGTRTRAALEREKNLLLRSIKELEFDHAMGKVGEADYDDMSVRLRARAVRLIQQLDNTTSGYREIIERELAKRLGKAGIAGEGATIGGSAAEAAPDVQSSSDALSRYDAESRADVERVPDSPGAPACPSCATVNDADARFCKSCGSKLLALLLALLVWAAPAAAQFQMPDPKEMAGIPRPVTDLPAGHVSVRLIRGQLSNNIQGHPVEINAGGKVLTVTTDENGRAEFSGVAAGTPARAVAVVDGERLESQEFPWPAGNGIRLMLVATAREGDAPPPVFQPQPGEVAFGNETRVIIDRTDDALQVYYILDIRNTARAPVQPASALTIDMPTGAQSTTVLAGAPQAVARGDRVTVSGPFAPGQTQVQVAFRMPFDSGDVAFEQALPIGVPGLAVLMKKTGEMTLTSPQLPNVQEREFEGERYVLAQGPAIPAGSRLSIAISGLPHHSPVPRRLALGAALLLLGAGFWAAARRPARSGDSGRAKQLAGRREKLYAELVRLEQQRRSGVLDAGRYADKRPALVAQLERVYRDLDAEA